RDGGQRGGGGAGGGAGAAGRAGGVDRLAAPALRGGVLLGGAPRAVHRGLDDLLEGVSRGDPPARLRRGADGATPHPSLPARRRAGRLPRAPLARVHQDRRHSLRESSCLSPCSTATGRTTRSTGREIRSSSSAASAVRR